MDALIGTFRRTHERRLEVNVPRWHLVGWPRSGGLDEQDAWTIEALQFTRDVMNNLEAEIAAPRAAELLDLSESVTHGE